MKFPNKKGFTLIELLVVIAIIGILSSIVLASLNSARAKGNNASVKANLHGIRSKAEVVSDDNGGNSSIICADPNIIAAIDTAILAGGDLGASVATRCNAISDAWAVNVLLKVPEGTDNYWCIDSTGAAKGETDELAGATVCA
jgi:prepilin-type N-terminal cleavage/methylation domain-containing protein